MRYIQALLLALSISFAGNAQFLALDSANVGGFESGTTFAANGWTEVNPGPIHSWALSNNAPAQSGARGAHITNAGSPYPYAYTPGGGARTCHLYRDVTIPAGSTNIKLKFYWKGQGDLTATARDLMFVSTAPTSLTPVANTPASPTTTLGGGATTIWTQPSLSTTYTPVTITLPLGLAGTTFRLIFTWINDATAGSGVPAAIDNISVNYNCGMPSAIIGYSTVCDGDTTTLADPSPGGVWTSSNTSVATIAPSGLVTALSQGTTTISYTTGCTFPATMVFNVRATPSPIAGPSSVCVDATAAMTDTATGGVWSTTGLGYATVNPATGVVTGVAVGIDTVMYTNGCGGGVTVRKAIWVKPNPTPITGPGTVCEGGATITLHNDTVGGTWSTIPTPNASVGAATGIVTGLADGTATIVYTSTIGCIAATVVTVLPQPEPITGVVPICVGGSFGLADALPGGSWSSLHPGIASVSSIGGVVGISAGTSTISYTDANMCGSATVIVTIDPLPGPIIGHDTVCVGATTTFANSAIGGTWESSFPSVATILTTSGLISGVAEGVSYITYTMPGGCIAPVKEVYVRDPPPPITGTTMELCPTDVITLTNPTPGGTWLSLSPGSATVGSTNGQVTGILPGVVAIRYRSPAGCFVYANVTVNPIPTAIIGADKYCATGKDTLFNATPGGTWSSVTSSVATITSTTGILTLSSVSSVTTGTVKYTLTSTGCSITKSFTVNPLPSPSVNFISSTFVTGTGYDSYQWYHSIHGKLPGATTYMVGAAFYGSYYVVVTDSNGCVGQSAPYAFTAGMSVGSVPSVSDVRVYPNPATDMVHIEAGVEVRAVISGLDGKKLIEADNASAVNIAALPSGVYVLSLYDKSGLKIAVEKLNKQ